MSITKNENWDLLTQEHEKFIKKEEASGYPIWMSSLYSNGPIIQEQWDNIPQKEVDGLCS